MNIICFHNPNEENGYLSNWYPAHFTVEGIEFSSMEQFMMYQKACRFHDASVAKEILSTNDVAEIKKLGREVHGYDENIWNGVRQIVVYEGLKAKFSQNAELKEKLVDTGDAILAECAVRDDLGDRFIHERSQIDLIKANGRGKICLGYALMMVREQL